MVIFCSQELLPGIIHNERSASKEYANKKYKEGCKSCIHSFEHPNVGKKNTSAKCRDKLLPSFNNLVFPNGRPKEIKESRSQDELRNGSLPHVLYLEISQSSFVENNQEYDNTRNKKSFYFFHLVLLYYSKMTQC